MIILSKKTCDLIKAEVSKSAIQAAAADGTLAIQHFAPELHASLTEDAAADGTGAFMIPQILSVVLQLVGVLIGVPKAAAEKTAAK
jgi:hypothetical protein